MVDVTERIGVVLVHGIGEQRRFEHLEGQGRLLIDALRRRPGADVTVDILASPGASYHSEQSTWASSPSVRIGITEGGQYREIFLHEVWWADVNEPYSIAKQFRFWLWALSVWNYPRKDSSTSAGFQAMTDPVIPGFGYRRKFIVRCQLFAVSTLFLMAAFPIGILVILAKRLLNLNPPDFLQTIVNYVSGVKLYNQRRRYGKSLFTNSESDFLDAMEEPPRVSVRRRMVEVMTDMALQEEPYERWYVLAHSLGSVVAFNGLMEPGEILANYVGKERWETLKGEGLAGPRTELPPGSPAYFDSGAAPQGALPATPPIPARPVWLEDDDVVYRHMLLANFKGLLTYGSPLEKFAAIWPARVSVNKVEPHFLETSEWINVYDPIDQISGVLRAFTPANVPARCVPALLNIGYSAHIVLLFAHLHYLNLAKKGSKDLGDAIAHWLLRDRPFRVPASRQGRWFIPYKTLHRLRWAAQAIQWVVLYLAIGVVGAYCVPAAVKLLPKKIGDRAFAVWDWLEAVARTAGSWVNSEITSFISVPGFVHDEWRWLTDRWMQLTTPAVRDWLSWDLDFIVACAIITLIVGIVASIVFFRRDPDDTQRWARRNPLAKRAYQAANEQFGLACTPAQPTVPWRQRVSAFVRRLVRR